MTTKFQTIGPLLLQYISVSYIINYSSFIENLYKVLYSMQTNLDLSMYYRVNENFWQRLLFNIK